MLAPDATGVDRAPLSWPAWPMSSPSIESAVVRVLRSGRWAISGMNVGYESEERAFSRKFASFVGAVAAVPTSNGSSALVAALEACGIRYGDEVLVPGLAWVACASAVIRVGAVPVFVDIDPEHYAMDPTAAEALVGPRTAAVMVTHLSSSVADLDAFGALCARHGLAMIEDCSQAHGAMWRGARLGTFGQAGAFSFQSSKLLTAGEGGVVVTCDSQLARLLQQLRADGREWMSAKAAHGFPDLTAGFGRQGHNFCMTEMQAAILSCGLDELDAQNEVRLQRVRHLEEQLRHIEGVRVIRRRNDSRVDRQTFWHLPIQVDSAAFGGSGAEAVRSALSRLAGIFLEPVGAPMPRHPLYRPHLYARFPTEHIDRLCAERTALPLAARLSETCFSLPHHALLADARTLDQFVERFAAVQAAMRRGTGVLEYLTRTTREFHGN